MDNIHNYTKTKTQYIRTQINYFIGLRRMIRRRIIRIYTLEILFKNLIGYYEYHNPRPLITINIRTHGDNTVDFGYS